MTRYIAPMKQNNKTLLCLLAGMMLIVQVAPAITSDNPYTLAITNRNLFALKAPVDPATLVVPPPPVNIPKVLLTGLTTLMGGKRCILRVPRAARPPEPAKEVSLFKAEGDPTEEGIQVLEIDLATARVKINNNGTEQTLDLSKDAPKSAAIPVPPGVGIPGVPRPGGIIPPPVVVAPPIHSSALQRPVRGAGPSADPSNNAASGVANGQVPQRQAMSLEDQTIMIEANRLATQHLVEKGELPPLPPTDLSDILRDEADAARNPPGTPRPPGQ